MEDGAVKEVEEVEVCKVGKKFHITRSHYTSSIFSCQECVEEVWCRGAEEEGTWEEEEGGLRIRRRS